MKKILVPTDFGETALNATQYALSIAKITKSSLVFFHAEEHAETAEHKKLRAQVQKIHLSEPGVKISFASTGKLFNSLTINELFSREHPELIIIGTNGETGFSKALFGTNSEEIINATCPVMVIPRHVQYTAIKNIAYASDLYKLNKEIERVVEFARYFDANIEVFHISPVFPDLGEVEEMDVPAKLKELSGEFSYSNINYYVEKTALDNQVNKGIEAYLEKKHPDLLVMFHEEKDGIDNFFSSSHSEKIAGHIKIPILVFPKI
jgi:nucleotide-binding universal stress UspA family protein